MTLFDRRKLIPRACASASRARSPIVLTLVGLALACTAAAETLTIGGNGAAGPLFERLCDAYRRQAPGVICRLVSPPLGSSGGIRALAVGKVDLAVVARPLGADEKTAVGRHITLASTPFVLATHGGLRRQGYSRAELAAVYSGRLANWDDGEPIRLVLRTRDDSDTEQLRALSPAMSEAVGIAEQRAGMAFASDDLDTLALLGRVPGSLGPITLGLLTTSGARLTPLALDGVAPTLANLDNGSYRWRRTLAVVLPPKASPAAQQFADFLRTPAAAELMRRNDYLPAAP